LQDPEHHQPVVQVDAKSTATTIIIDKQLLKHHDHEIELGEKAMKHLVINSALTIHRQVFAMRTIIPVAVMLTIILLALLLPGTVFAGPGTSSTRCPGGC